MLRTRSLLAATALTLLAALGVTGPAAANQLNHAPTYQKATSNAWSYGGSALGLGLNDNRAFQQNSGLHTGGHPVKAPYVGGPQVNAAPTKQTATSNAFAYHGDATALSLNNNSVVQQNGVIGPGGQINIAPTVQTSTSNAFAFGGSATAVSGNTNSVVQDNTSIK